MDITYLLKLGVIVLLSKKSLGKLIKSARSIKSKEINRLYTQRMLANDLNKSQSYIGDLESGRTYPSYPMLNKIADICNVPLSFFQFNNLDNNLNELLKFLLNRPSFIKFLEFDISKLDDKSLANFINELLENIKIISKKYK